mmetsp:Transcript_13373/g.19275  ORF Transcript_13373/g.19275 Transcript_13373/m.19275 type:complete len:214 (-) Transcript_13373:227-868(-)
MIVCRVRENGTWSLVRKDQAREDNARFSYPWVRGPLGPSSGKEYLVPVPFAVDLFSTLPLPVLRSLPSMSLALCAVWGISCSQRIEELLQFLPASFLEGFPSLRTIRCQVCLSFVSLRGVFPPVYSSSDGVRTCVLLGSIPSRRGHHLRPSLASIRTPDIAVGSSFGSFPFPTCLNASAPNTYKFCNLSFLQRACSCGAYFRGKLSLFCTGLL